MGESGTELGSSGDLSGGELDGAALGESGAEAGSSDVRWKCIWQA